MVKIVNNKATYDNFCRWLELQSGEKVGFDTETTGLNPRKDKILLLQFGNKKVQYVIDVAKIATKNNQNLHDLFVSINELEIILVGHNIKYDYKMVKSNYNIEIDKIMCTMIAAQLLIMGRKHIIKTNLATTLKRFMGIKMEKKVRLEFINKKYGTSFTDEQLEYAAKDVEFLLPLLNKLLKSINDGDLSKVAMLEFNSIAVTGDMELNGALINTKKWLALEQVALDDAELIRQKLDKSLKPFVETDNLFDEVIINYNSVPQVKKALSSAFGFELSSTGRPLLETIDNPIAEDLLNYRSYLKLSGTYGSEFLKKHLDEKTGRIYSSFYQLGTATGRYSSKNPKLNWGNIW